MKKNGLNRIMAFLLVLGMLGTTFLTSACAKNETSDAAATAQDKMTEDEKQALAEEILASMSDEVSIETGQGVVEQSGANNELTTVFSTNDGIENGKETITVLEIVPHPIFSVFPYLIDWSSSDKTIQQDFNKHTLMGYDGIRYYISAQSGISTENSRFGFAQMSDSMIYKEHMGTAKENYDIDIYNRYTNGNTHREYFNDDIKAGSGYFMYVGSVGSLDMNPKGLYCINPDSIILPATKTDFGALNDAKDNYGIRTEIRPITRTKEKESQGNLGVVAPAYYVDIKSEDEWKDTAFGIEAKTLANYEVSFSVASNNDEFGYVISGIDKVKAGTGVAHCDYLAYTEDPSLKEKFDEDYGYDFFAGGNYIAHPIKMSFDFGTYKADVENQYDGVYYVRKSDSLKTDGLSDISKGYFRKVSKSDRTLSDSTSLYQIEFEKTEPGKGSYQLGISGVQTELSDANKELTVFSKLLFEYSGSEKGYYRVDFIHAARAGVGISNVGKNRYDGARYKAKVEEIITDGNGRFALTSTNAVDGEVEYAESSEKGISDKDYADVVCYIDFMGCNYGYWESWYQDENWNWVSTPSTDSYYKDGYVGACIGNDGGNREIGDWVFIPYDDGETHKYTTVEQYKSIMKNPKFGDCIYVEDQERKRCVYVLYELCNNEWFKLLLYLEDRDNAERANNREEPEVSLAYYAYKNKQASNNSSHTPSGIFNSGEEIKNYYKDDIQAFNETYNIKIITKQPDDVTEADVSEADLIYVNGENGNTYWGLNTWNEYIRKRGTEYEKYLLYWLPSFESVNDINMSVAYKIYDECIVKKECGIIINSNSNVTSLKEDATRNLSKLTLLFALFDDPLVFENFMPWYPDSYNDQYTTLDADGNAHAYANSAATIGQWYNFGDTYKGIIAHDDKWGDYVWGEESQIGVKIPEEVSSKWQLNYFNVINFEYDEVLGGYRRKLEPEDIKIWVSSTEDGSGVCKLEPPPSYISDLYAKYPWFGYYNGTRVQQQYVRWYASEEPENGIYKKWSDTYFLPQNALQFFFKNGTATLNVYRLFHPKQGNTISKPTVIVLNADDSSVRAEDPDTTYYYFYVDSFAALDSTAKAFDVDYKVVSTVASPPALKPVIYSRLLDGSELKSEGGVAYDTKYTMEGTLISGDFVSNGILRSDVSYVDYVITATDTNGQSGKAIVRFMVRESFVLN